jgi:hypothetical protein
MRSTDISKTYHTHYNSGIEERLLACPYFIPAEIHERGLWPHRERLPLGDGFAGRCAQCPPESRCDDETLRLHCNLGYAECVHLPAKRAFDAVRFRVHRDSATLLRVCFTCERAHRPAASGELRYDPDSRRWLDEPDPGMLALAQAALRAWVERQLIR